MAERAGEEAADARGGQGARVASEDVPGQGRLFEHILVPTDGSRGAQRAVDHALDLARQYDATVHVLHVIDEQTRAETPALSSQELLLEKFTDTADAIIDDVVAAAEQLDVETVRCCCRGVPYDEITRYAHENDVDLIVMGVHGAGRTTRPHVGSTTERVIRTARPPVLPV